MRTRRKLLALSVVLATQLALVGGARATEPLPAEETLPNLKVESRQLRIARPDWPSQGPDVLRFSTDVENHGTAAFEVVGLLDPENAGEADLDPFVPGDGEPATATALQCTRFAGPAVNGAARACVRYERIGTLAWHAAHHHFHLDGLAQYRLRADDGGEPGDVLDDSGKVGFCLTDSKELDPRPRLVDHPLANGAHDVAMFFATRWYGECTHFHQFPYPSLRMGISPGWEDVYGSALPGQQLQIDGLPDGTYWLETLVNPEGVSEVRESTREDNRHLLAFCLQADGTKVAEGRCTTG